MKDIIIFIILIILGWIITGLDCLSYGERKILTGILIIIVFSWLKLSRKNQKIKKQTNKKNENNPILYSLKLVGLFLTMILVVILWMVLYWYLLKSTYQN